MGLIDTHTHLDGFVSDGTLDAVLGRAVSAGLEAMIAIGTEPEDWAMHREIARSRPGLVHFTAGIHPCRADAGWKAAAAQLEGYWTAGIPRPVALGECGLDRFHLPKDAIEAERAFEFQRAAFEAQLDLARRLGCPLIIHSREAFRECVDAIDKAGIDWTKVVFHCFSGGPAEIAELARRGGRGSFTGILTYKNAENVRAAAAAQGLERLMIETDSPYLAPAPHRGSRNEPAFVRLVAERASELFGVPGDRVAEITTANARAFFAL